MTESAVEKQTFKGWAILELMGHRKLAGYVTEQEMFGSPMCRLDIPGADGPNIEAQPPATQFYTASAIYCLTPTTEDLARRMAGGYRPEPVAEWQLPKPALPSRPTPRRDDDDFDPAYDDEPEGYRQD